MVSRASWKFCWPGGSIVFGGVFFFFFFLTLFLGSQLFQWRLWHFFGWPSFSPMTRGSDLPCTNLHNCPNADWRSCMMHPHISFPFTNLSPLPLCGGTCNNACFPTTRWCALFLSSAISMVTTPLDFVWWFYLSFSLLWLFIINFPLDLKRVSQQLTSLV